jgi:hypothetical protein
MSRHFHFCLLSDQLVPNLMSILHLKPDTLVLAETRQMREKNMVDNLIAALRLVGSEFDYSSQERKILCSIEEPNNLPRTAEAIQKILDDNPGVQWSVNLTGGNKVMSLAAFKVFDRMNVPEYYVEISHPDELLLLNENATFRCGHRLTCGQFMCCYGFRAEKDKIQKGWKPEDFLPLARAIACEEQQIHIKLGREDWEPLRKGKHVLAKGQITLGSSRLIEAFDRESNRRQTLTGTSLKPLAREDKCLIGPIDKLTGDFLTGGWLEILLYGLLDKNAEALGIWDVRLNLKMVKGQDRTFENELDVVFMHNQQLHVIECKTGKQEHDPGTNALYKIEAVLSQLHALKRSVILATTAENIYQKAAGQVLEGEIKGSLIGRATHNEWKILDRPCIQKLAAATSAEEEVRLLREYLKLN